MAAYAQDARNGKMVDCNRQLTGGEEKIKLVLEIDDL
jgi:hypothetical protein